jgi:hypothetical protein
VQGVFEAVEGERAYVLAEGNAHVMVPSKSRASSMRVMLQRDPVAGRKLEQEEGV